MTWPWPIEGILVTRLCTFMTLMCCVVPRVVMAVSRDHRFYHSGYAFTGEHIFHDVAGHVDNDLPHCDAGGIKHI